MRLIENKRISIFLYEQWSQFFEGQQNWYEMDMIEASWEYDCSFPSFQIDLGLLGFSLVIAFLINKEPNETGKETLKRVEELDKKIDEGKSVEDAIGLDKIKVHPKADKEIKEIISNQ